jgi:hypothetical protein
MAVVKEYGAVGTEWGGVETLPTSRMEGRLCESPFPPAAPVYHSGLVI